MLIYNNLKYTEKSICTKDHSIAIITKVWFENNMEILKQTIIFSKIME